MKAIIIYLMLFLTPFPLLAQELCFSWEYAAEEQAQITGFRIYKNNTVALDNIDPALRTVCVEDPDESSTRRQYAVTAYNTELNDESGHSNPAFYPIALGKIKAGLSKRKLGSGKWIH